MTKYKIVSTKGRNLAHTVYPFKSDTTYVSKQEAQEAADMFNMGSDTETAVVEQVYSVE